MNLFYPLTLFLFGIAAAFVNVNGVRYLHLVPCLFLTTIVCGSLYQIITCALLLYELDDMTVNALTVLACICDAITSIAFDYCYIIRLQCFIISNATLKWSKVLYVFPVVYCLTDLITIATVFGASVPDLEIFFPVLNIILACTGFFCHTAICYNLALNEYMLHSDSKIGIGKVLKFLLPGSTTVLFLASCIVGIEDPDVGVPLIWFFWALDHLAFVFFNNLIVSKNIGKTENESCLRTVKTKRPEAK